MEKIYMICFYLIVISTASAQSTRIDFKDDSSIDFINKTMDSNKIPLLFEEEGSSDTIVRKIFYNGICIAQTYSNLTLLWVNKHNYLLFFYDYAGYDRILLINKKEFSFYYSDKFNYNQSSSYKYSLNKQYVRILYLETRTKEFVPIHKYDVSKDFIL